MHKSAFLVLLIIIVVCAISFYLIMYGSKKQPAQSGGMSTDKYTVKNPDPKLQPEFSISGKILVVEKAHSSIDVMDDASQKTYTVIVPPETTIKFENFPTEQNIASKKLLFIDLVPNDQVMVIAENFAGNTTIKSKVISVSKFNRVGKHIPIP